MAFSHANRRVSLALLAALLLRAAIPDGYMPAPVGSGLLVELCPAGVPAAFMEALAGATGHHHHDAASTAASHYDAGQCPIGHLLSVATAVDMPAAQPEPPAASPPNPNLTFLPRATRVTIHRSRGPPA